MKLNTLAATLVAAAGFLASTMASATIVQIDPDGAGSDPAVAIRQFSLTPSQDYSIQLNLGADGIFNSGDTFSETINYSVFSVKNPVGSTIVPAGITNFTVQATLSGFVTGVSGPIAAGASISNILADTFGITFNPGGSVLFKNSSANGGLGGVVATAVVLDGGSTGFTFQNSTPTLQFGVDALFTSIDDNYFRDSSGNPLSTYLPLLFGVADASANLQSVAFTDPSLTQVAVTVSDNGGTASINIPEPTSVALVGVALLGLGLSGRRLKAKKSA